MGSIKLNPRPSKVKGKNRRGYGTYGSEYESEESDSDDEYSPIKLKPRPSKVAAKKSQATTNTPNAAKSAATTITTNAAKSAATTITTNAAKSAGTESNTNRLARFEKELQPSRVATVNSVVESQLGTNNFAKFKTNANSAVSSLNKMSI
jgi:cell wall-associated NlpC family hydrolase